MVGLWWELEKSMFSVVAGDKTWSEHWEQAHPFVRQHTYGPTWDKFAAGDHFGAGNDVGYAGAAVATIVLPVKAIPRVPKLPAATTVERAPGVLTHLDDAATAGANLGAANTADSLLPGLPASAPKPLGLGSTGRTVPGDLAEQLAMTEVRSAPGGTALNMRTPMGDPRWPAADG